jgi:predicted ribosome quality control (RQC) complex YloA/Tae2 family protein
MYLDAITLSALLDELLDEIVGGRIQDSVDIDDWTLGMEVYARQKRQYLILSADASAPRVYLVPDKVRRGTPKPSQMGLLIRRHVETGIIQHISQPLWERALHFDISGPEGAVTLIVEPMERRANVLLVQDGTIMDCMRRVGTSENRYRVSLPGKAYVEPPPQTGKFDPYALEQEQIAEILQVDDAKVKASQALSRKVLGLSPLLAKEIVYRATGNSDTRALQADSGDVIEALRAVMTPLSRREWQPGIILQDGIVVGFSVYPITHLEGWEPAVRVSDALGSFYGAPTGTEAYTAAKAPVKAAIDEAIARASAKLTSLESSMTDDSQREQIKLAGEMILAYQYAIGRGQTELVAEYEADKPALKIKLDASLTPLENAQAYFARYNKAKRALDDVPKLIREARIELNHLAQLATDLDLAANWPEIDEVQTTLTSKGLWRGKPVKRIGGSMTSGPLRLVSLDGFVIWVGRNSRQNELVSFSKGTSEDFWLHVHGVPGAHVVVKNDGRTIPDAVMDAAASLAVHYSALRGEPKAPVDVTRLKYVRKIKGAAAGMVTYRNETTVLAESKDEKSLGALL